MSLPDELAPLRPPSVIGYAPQPAAPRRLARRALRWRPAWALLAVVGIGVAGAPMVWRQWKLLRSQDACMTAELPRAWPAFEENPAAARALAVARPSEYRLGPDGSAARVDPRWATWLGEVGRSTWTGNEEECRGLIGVSHRWREDQSTSMSMPPTVCLHERHTPDGRRRLVAIEGRWGERTTVIEPATWRGGPGRTVWRYAVGWDDRVDVWLDTVARELPGFTRLGAGVPDPADRSRLTVPFVHHGIAGTLEYRLTNDDRVTIALIDPDAFWDRSIDAIVAARRAATRPTGDLAP